MRETRTGTQSNHIVVVGSDFELRHTVVDDLAQAVDLTSATLSAAVKLNESDTVAAATFTVTTINAASGTVQMVLSDTETSKLVAGNRYYYDMKVVLSSEHTSYPGLTDYPLFGILEVVAPATS